MDNIMKTDSKNYEAHESFTPEEQSSSLEQSTMIQPPYSQYSRYKPAPSTTQQVHVSYLDVSNETLINHQAQHSTPQKNSTHIEHSKGERWFNVFLVMLVFSGFGLLIDGCINFSKAMFSFGSSEIFWLFLPVMAFLGLLLGIIFGTKALDALFIIFRGQQTYDGLNQASISYPILKAIGVGLLLSIATWFVVMLFV